MRNFHWGHGILVFFIIYIFSLVIIMIKASRQDHSLVVEDYYTQDIGYQEKYDKIVNAMTDSKDFTVTWIDSIQMLQLVYNTNSPKDGTVVLYNPANKWKDQSFTFNIPSGDSIILKQVGLTKGRWIIKSDWKEEGKTYYLEKELYISGS